jgi:hypothetical protein
MTTTNPVTFSREATRDTDDTVVSFVPMQAVSEEAASIEALEVRRFGDVKRGFTFFEEDDVSALFTALF